LSATQINFYTPVGSTLELTEARAQQIDRLLREFPELRYTVTNINSGVAAGKIYGAVYMRLKDRKDSKLGVDEPATPMRQKLASVPGIVLTPIGQTDIGGDLRLSG